MPHKNEAVKCYGFITGSYDVNIIAVCILYVMEIITCFIVGWLWPMEIS